MQLFLALFSILSTAAPYLLALVVNEWVFADSEFVRGVNWIYLPAGIRLLCILLFGGWGAIGVLLASWMVGFGYYFPEAENFTRAFWGGIISAAGPYLIYLLAQRLFGLAPSLANLTVKRLLMCIVAYAFDSPMLHYLLFIYLGVTENFAATFVAMVTGDLVGSLIIVYVAKGLLAMVRTETPKRSGANAPG